MRPLCTSTAVDAGIRRGLGSRGALLGMRRDGERERERNSLTLPRDFASNYVIKTPPAALGVY